MISRDTTPGGQPAGTGNAERLDRISGQLDELVKGRRRRDWIITGLVAAVAVLALLLSLEHDARTGSNSARITAEAQAQKEACLSSDRIRAADIAEKRSLYSLLVKHHALTAAESVRQLAAVRAADAPRNCARLGGKTAKGTGTLPLPHGFRAG
jgi:hypothetical protein